MSMEVSGQDSSMYHFRFKLFAIGATNSLLAKIGTKCLATSKIIYGLWHSRWLNDHIDLAEMI